MEACVYQCVSIDVAAGHVFVGGGGREAGHGRTARHGDRWPACSTTNACTVATNRSDRACLTVRRNQRAGHLSSQKRKEKNTRHAVLIASPLIFPSTKNVNHLRLWI
ncbi:hypothetical protein PVAP13_6NG015331 [Panicum virgatum]|uniref:Uncharacterized protein n=1 Tax=Panicum virgatum TaxID=38727 RepID=A0A8T0QSX4_PANVG|nr:hypothetical protein PVAP13_6NG015331 [Panicum virgatum]